MRNTLFILLVAVIAILVSCSSKEDNSHLHLFSIETVDDELGLAYGTTTETNGSEIKTFYVVAPYDCITYDSLTNVHYLDVDKFEASTDTLKDIQLSTYKLAGM